MVKVTWAQQRQQFWGFFNSAWWTNNSTAVLFAEFEHLTFHTYQKLPPLTMKSWAWTKHTAKRWCNCMLRSWTMTIAIDVNLYVNTPYPSRMTWQKFCAKGKRTMCCKETFFYFLFLTWDLVSRSLEMLSWKDIFKKEFLKRFYPKDPNWTVIYWSDVTQDKHKQDFIICIMTSTVIMNSLFEKAVIGNRVSLSEVTLKHMRTLTLCWRNIYI